MSIKALLIICCSVVFVSAGSAQNRDKKGTSPKITSHTKLMDERVSELMADRVGFKKDITLKALAELEEQAELEEEELLFPADELYGSNWDTRWVNPFREGKVEFPDSCAINCASFTMPIDSMTRITSKYGPRRRRMHKGIDLKVQIGDTIRAAFDGKIRICNFERRGYGNYVVIRHPNGLETIYGHLSKILVKINNIVRAGDPIALGGNTGRSTGSHLHFETRFLGQAINPSEIIDFENGVPHQDTYVFHNVKINGRKSNIYTSSDNQLVYHRVKSGDTLGKIARLYGTTVNELCRLNGLKSTSILRLGQSIRCSANGQRSVSKTRSKQGASSVQKASKTKVEATTAAVASLQDNTSNSKPGQTPVYHRIKSGDTLGAIATKYGTTVSKLCQLNGISKTTVLRLGRSIRCS
ncbi:peptidoglycan DD-metalloendopeptidase family protein [Parabacteroides chinchillae]|uniref:Murein DD-endopeptidase MepM and murein hydrolase activator NlpD, contain LysM domain n=1 Tax=Parabacteroides chinchillae TaxID=871327 RepID=A0A8G2BXX9_9BACT|nr:peptidoglycan DD-metalloendopeptidase family protein [Parabacteroides chinchillae]SEG11358.1 Murein DD-endopeptidase MepM and murein hydrolase activator NlpD, contain LysM domain [Parabacteroides chinchillae]